MLQRPMLIITITDLQPIPVQRFLFHSIDTPPTTQRLVGFMLNFIAVLFRGGRAGQRCHRASVIPPMMSLQPLTISE